MDSASSPPTPAIEGVPEVILNGQLGGLTMGAAITDGSFQNNIQAQDGFSWVVGKHTMKFGGEFTHKIWYRRGGPVPNGQFVFGGGESGIDFADFLIGAPDQFVQSSKQTFDGRSKAGGVYFQDSVRMRPDLTLNYGVRWEFAEPWSETRGRIQAYVPGQQSTVFANSPTGWVFPGDKGKRVGAARVLGAYTWAKSLDDASSFSESVNPYQAGLSYGLSTFDIKQNFVVSYSYDLPFGHWLATDKSLAGKALNGWTLVGITRFTGGFPVLLQETDDRSLCGCDGQGIHALDLPNYNGQGVKKLNPRSASGSSLPYFDTSNFSQMALGVPGNANRSFFHGPGINNSDASLHKLTPLSERARKKHRLIEIDWPEFGDAACPPRRGAAEYTERIASLRQHMEERKLTHAVIYGDREHFANLMYLTGFDPRFEESLLIVGASGKPLIVVGNECEGQPPLPGRRNSEATRLGWATSSFRASRTLPRRRTSSSPCLSSRSRLGRLCRSHCCWR